MDFPIFHCNWHHCGSLFTSVHLILVIVIVSKSSQGLKIAPGCQSSGLNRLLSRVLMPSIKHQAFSIPAWSTDCSDCSDCSVYLAQPAISCSISCSISDHSDYHSVMASLSLLGLSSARNVWSGEPKSKYSSATIESPRCSIHVSMSPTYKHGRGRIEVDLRKLTHVIIAYYCGIENIWPKYAKVS